MLFRSITSKINDFTYLSSNRKQISPTQLPMTMYSQQQHWYTTALFKINEVRQRAERGIKTVFVDKIDDLKARDVVVLDVSKQSNITDYMVICSGTSKTHVKAIAENLVVEAKKAGIPPLGVEGRESSEWVLVDMGDVILHVMQDQTRDFYQLEKLWSEKQD